MATEKDIREFIQQNKIRIPKDDKFMEDLLKQIELLPTPASMQPKDNSEQLKLLEQISKALVKHNRRTALTLLFGVMFIGAIVCAVPYILGYSNLATIIPAQYITYVTTGIYILGALAILAVIMGLYRKTEFI